MTRLFGLACLAIAGLASGCSSINGLFAAGPGPAAAAVKPAPAAVGAQAPLPRALYLKLVAGLESQGKAHAALAYLEDYAAKFPGDDEAVLLRAKALAAVGRPQAAAAAFRRLLGTPLGAAAHDGLGRLAATQGDWAGASDQFRQAIRLSPTDAKALNNYGFALLKLGQLADAEFSLRQAAELAPGSEETRANLILCLHLEGKIAAEERLIAAAPAEGRRSLETALAAWPPPTDGEAQAKENPAP